MHIYTSLPLSPWRTLPHTLGPSSSGGGAGNSSLLCSSGWHTAQHGASSWKRFWDSVLWASIPGPFSSHLFSWRVPSTNPQPHASLSPKTVTALAQQSVCRGPGGPSRKVQWAGSLPAHPPVVQRSRTFSRSWIHCQRALFVPYFFKGIQANI